MIKDTTSKVVVAGGTGFIGRSLIPALVNKGYECVVLTRSPKEHHATPFLKLLEEGQLKLVQWNPVKDLKEFACLGENKENKIVSSFPKTLPDQTSWMKEIDGAYAVINLAGASLAEKRWTEAHKLAMWTSRINATRSCVSAIAHSSTPPAVFISGSAVGYYGLENKGIVTETHGPGTDFLARLSVAWEEEANKLHSIEGKSSSTRLAIIRTGLVLGASGGMLQKMLPLFKYYLGGQLGSGTQYVPWIHERDAARGIIAGIENDIVGPYNLSAPNPVTNKEFSDSLAKVTGTYSWAHVPEFAANLALGEFATYVLNGTRQVPTRLQEEFEFEFEFPIIDEALEDIVSQTK